jgi:hypothetical protein
MTFGLGLRNAPVEIVAIHAAFMQASGTFRVLTVFQRPLDSCGSY